MVEQSSGQYRNRLPLCEQKNTCYTIIIIVESEKLQLYTIIHVLYMYMYLNPIFRKNKQAMTLIFAV